MTLNNGPVDLHVHTTASDGTSTPRELVDQAREAGLSAVAITDHDTIDGIAPARLRGVETGIEVISGVEISATFDPPGTLHILGYFIDETHPALLDRIQWVQTQRSNRNPRIIERLNDLGLEITLEDAQRISGSGQLGRPHIAQALVDRGQVASLQEAFDRYLDSSAPAYVQKEKLSPEESIRLIRESGGVAVLAHPYQTRRKSLAELESLIAELAEIGLGGIECYYSRHTADQTATYLAFAERYGLVATGGSDFHGTSKPEIRLGAAGSADEIPYSVVDSLRERSALARTGA